MVALNVRQNIGYQVNKHPRYVLNQEFVAFEKMTCKERMPDNMSLLLIQYAVVVSWENIYRFLLIF